MKFNLKDVIILVVPLVIMILITPLLPEKIPMQWNSKGNVIWYLDNSYYFILGLIPYFIYLLYKLKRNKR